MKEYKSTKIVNAIPMRWSVWAEYRKQLTTGVYSDATHQKDEDGYMVVYDRGTEKEYFSWSPKEQFETGYQLIKTDTAPGRAARC